MSIFARLCEKHDYSYKKYTNEKINQTVDNYAADRLRGRCDECTDSGEGERYRDFG